MNTGGPMRRGDRRHRSDGRWRAWSALLALCLAGPWATAWAEGHLLNVLEFSSATYRVAADAGSVTLPVNRIDGGTGPVSAVAVAGFGLGGGDTAADGVDFSLQPTTLVWADGDTSTRYVTVAIYDQNYDYEVDFAVFLRDPEDPNGFGGDYSQTTVTITPPAAAVVERIEVVSGGGQSGRPGDELQPFVIGVVDSQGNPLANAGVAWSVEPAAAGSLANQTTTTSADGQSSNILTLASTEPLVVKALVLQEGGNGVPVEVSFAVNTAAAATGSGLTDNQRAVKRSLDAACQALLDLGDNLTPEQADLLATCQNLDPASDADLLDSLAPEEVAAQGQMILDVARLQGAGLLRRMAAVRAGERGLSLAGLRVSIAGQQFSPELLAELFGTGVSGGSAGEEVSGIASRWGLFINADVLFGDRERSRNEAGYDIDSQGVTLGADYRLSNSLLLGGALGYNANESRFDSDGGRTEMDGLNLSAYGSWFPSSAFFLDALLRAGRNDIDTRRRVSSGVEGMGSTRGWEYGASLSAGYEFDRKAFTASPYGRIGYYRTDIDAYTESAAGSGAGTGSVLAIDRQELDSLTAVLGGRFSYAINTRHAVYLLQLNGEWEHEFRDEARAISARFLYDPSRSRFNLFTDSPDSDYFNLGLGLSAVFTHGYSAFLYYESRLGQDYVRLNWINAGFRMEL